MSIWPIFQTFLNYKLHFPLETGDKRGTRRQGGRGRRKLLFHTTERLQLPGEADASLTSKQWAEWSGQWVQGAEENRQRGFSSLIFTKIIIVMGWEDLGPTQRWHREKNIELPMKMHVLTLQEDWTKRF